MRFEWGFFLVRKTKMTNRRKIGLYGEQLNHKHESNRILKGEVIKILMLWRFCIILVEMGRATSPYACKKKVRGSNIHLQSWTSE